MSTPRPTIWTHVFYKQCPTFGWVPEFEEHARKYFDFVTTEDLEKAPEKSALLNGKLVAHLMKILPTLTNLKVIANSGVGVNHLDIHALAAKGIKVSNTPDVLNYAVAELTLALLLSSARHIIRGNHLAKETVCPMVDTDMQAVEVRGSTIGIVGMGNIGLTIGKLLKPFEAKIVYHNRSRRTEEVENSVGASYFATLDEMLPECDFVILMCPLTLETKHLMGRKQFTLMKKTATLINVSRGGVVDTGALVDALRTKEIRAAALDVTDPEPLPAGHDLRSLENVIILPHWGSQTFTTRFAMFDTCVKNLKAYLIDSVPMPNEVKV